VPIKEASDVAPRGFRAGPTTLAQSERTEEDSTFLRYSDRNRRQASFLGHTRAVAFSRGGAGSGRRRRQFS